jgi:hypothetical protein
MINCHFVLCKMSRHWLSRKYFGADFAAAQISGKRSVPYRRHARIESSLRGELGRENDDGTSSTNRGVRKSDVRLARFQYPITPISGNDCNPIIRPSNVEV